MTGLAESSCQPCGELSVLVNGLQSNKGRVTFQLFDTKESYRKQENAYKKEYIKIIERTSIWTVRGLPLKEYAVVIYHDENNNGEFDINAIGYPQESYGFSNNVRPRLAQPAFEKVKFSLEQPMKSIEIVAQ